MLDRSPDELGSGDEGDSDSDMEDGNETTVDGERVIYSWMRKGGIGEFFLLMNQCLGGGPFFNPNLGRGMSCRQARVSPFVHPPVEVQNKSEFFA